MSMVGQPAGIGGARVLRHFPFFLYVAIPKQYYVVFPSISLRNCYSYDTIGTSLRYGNEKKKNFKVRRECV